MKEVKPKRFGQCWAFSYGSGPAFIQRPGISLKLTKGIPEDEDDGEWLRLMEAKRVHNSLGAAIAHIEKLHAKETK